MGSYDEMQRQVGNRALEYALRCLDAADRVAALPEDAFIEVDREICPACRRAEMVVALQSIGLDALAEAVDAADAEIVNSDEPAKRPPPFLPEVWSEDAAARYDSAEELVTAVKCTSAAYGWAMPDIDGIRKWWEEQNEQVG